MQKPQTVGIYGLRNTVYQTEADQVQEEEVFMVMTIIIVNLQSLRLKYSESNAQKMLILNYKLKLVNPYILTAKTVCRVCKFFFSHLTTGSVCAITNTVCVESFV